MVQQQRKPNVCTFVVQRSPETTQIAVDCQNRLDKKKARNVDTVAVFRGAF